MGQISLQQPQIGLPCSTEDPKVQGNFITLQNVINGSIDSTNLSASLAQSVAVNQSGQTVKGSSIISTSQSTSSTTFTTLATPDQVTGIVLSAAGVIQIDYFATWQDTNANNGTAAIFIGANQLKTPAGSGASPAVQQAAVANRGTDAGSTNYALFSTPYGLESHGSNAYSGDVTTGEAMAIQSGLTGTLLALSPGGPCRVFAPAGLYTVSVQFKVLSAGSVTVSNRRLYVKAESYG